MYYYIYYLLAIFARKYNNRNNDFAFTAIVYYILLGSLGIIYLFYFLVGKSFFKEQSKLVIVFSALIPAIIHYFALLRNKKYLTIVKEYDSDFKFNVKAIIVAIILILYVLLAISLAFYLGSLARVAK